MKSRKTNSGCGQTLAYQVSACILANKGAKQAWEQLTINSGVLEFPCGNVVVEEQVNLAKSAILRLGKTKPTPNVADKVGSRVEESGFGSPIPS